MTFFELKKKLLPVSGSYPLWFVLMQTGVAMLFLQESQ